MSKTKHYDNEVKINVSKVNKLTNRWSVEVDGKCFSRYVSASFKPEIYLHDIPQVRKLYCDETISTAAKAVFGYLESNKFYNTGVCPVTVNSISKMMGIAYNTAKKAVDCLVSHQIIQRGKFYYGTNVGYQFKINPAKLWKFGNEEEVYLGQDEYENGYYDPRTGEYYSFDPCDEEVMYGPDYVSPEELMH